MAYPYYLRLQVNAKLRLNWLQTNKVVNPNAKPWKECRKQTFLDVESDISEGFNTRGTTRTPVWITWKEGVFRHETWADLINPRRIEHQGWFSDEDCSRTLRGCVVSLTHGRFMAGYVSSDSGERVYYNKVFDDEEDAAIFADSEAQYYAGEEQEYNTRWNAVQDIYSKQEEKREELLEKLALRNDKRFPKARREAHDLIDELRELEKKLKDDYADIE